MMGPTTVSILVSMAGPHLSHLLDPAWCRGCQLLMGGTGYLCDWLYDPGIPILTCWWAGSHMVADCRVEGGGVSGNGGGGWAGVPGG